MDNNTKRGIEFIDAINSEDPNLVEYDGREWPAELLYSVRMSEELEAFVSHAEMALVFAVRAQHIGRWKFPRSAYPMDRAGYLKWRQELYGIHASLAGEQLKNAGVDSEIIEKTELYIREKAKRNTPETQIVEDVACLVFLKWYFPSFVEKHEENEEKLLKIIAKTWGKMSERARERALTFTFEENHLALIQKALSM